MVKRSLGRTGESATILGFGCMRLPLKSSNPEDIDKELAIDMIRTAIDRGVNYIDTAYPYHSGVSRNNPGASEPLVAEALADGYREKVLLATKLPTWLIQSRADMDRYLDEQLKRLRVSRIDFYLAHNLNSGVWGNLENLGIKEFMDSAVKDGRVGHPAFSFHDNYFLFEKIVESYDWTMCQIQYNYLDRDFQAGQKGLKLAHSKGLGVVIMEPLRGGFLVNYVPPEAKEILSKARPTWSLPAWGLNWLWNQSEISVVLSGMSVKDQVMENLSLAEAWKENLVTQAELAALDKVSEIFASRMKTSCTGCGYCMPCPSGVDIPKNLSFLNQYFLFDSKETKERCHYFYNVQVQTSERPDNCSVCHECEEKCPQHIAIPDFLAQAGDIYLKA
ncbi:MAG: aldo/keto reductase [Deltaproteobacteria bacterium]|nr:aldo/keto reductase [Deltaproteobacteria bacterium]